MASRDLRFRRPRRQLQAVVLLFLLAVTCAFVNHRTYERKHKRLGIPTSRARGHAVSQDAAKKEATLPDPVSKEGTGVREVPRQTEVDQGAASSKRSSQDYLRQRAKTIPLRHLRIAAKKYFTHSAETWESCAVVGNSGTLLGKGFGSLIDKHATVLRLNHAPLEGHLEDLGEKTTVSFINGWKLNACANSKQNGDCSDCWKHYKEGRRVHVVSYMILEDHLRDAEACKVTNPNKFYMVREDLKDFSNQIVHHYASERIKRNYPKEMWPRLVRERRKISLHYSSGFQAVIFALTLCSDVSLFGFGKSEVPASNGGQGQHHYFENTTLEEVPDHDYEAEMLFYEEVENRTAGLIETFAVQKLKVY